MKVAGRRAAAPGLGLGLGSGLGSRLGLAFLWKINNCLKCLLKMTR